MRKKEPTSEDEKKKKIIYKEEVFVGFSDYLGFCEDFCFSLLLFSLYNILLPIN